jgi:hypothetical protein
MPAGRAREDSHEVVSCTVVGDPPTAGNLARTSLHDSPDCEKVIETGPGAMGRWWRAFDAGRIGGGIPASARQASIVWSFDRAPDAPRPC